MLQFQRQLFEVSNTMETSRIYKFAQNAYAKPVVKGLVRAGKSTLPLVAGLGAGIAAYHINSDFRSIVDISRATLNHLPGGSELFTSALTMGLVPDFLAQRYEGSKFNWFRLAGMTIVGAVTGRVLLRSFYNLQDVVFPAHEQFSLIKKILVDQCVYTPLYFCGFYLPSTNLVHGRQWKGFTSTLWPNLVKVLPKNWVYWGAALTLIYNLSPDTRIYAANAFSLVWFSFLSNYSRNQGK